MQSTKISSWLLVCAKVITLLFCSLPHQLFLCLKRAIQRKTILYKINEPVRETNPTLIEDVFSKALFQ